MALCVRDSSGAVVAEGASIATLTATAAATGLELVDMATDVVLARGAPSGWRLTAEGLAYAAAPTAPAGELL